MRHPVLVLDALRQAVYSVALPRALQLVYNERADFIDEYDQARSFDQWVDDWQAAKDLCIASEKEVIKLGRGEMPVPHVIALRHYNHMATCSRLDGKNGKLPARFSRLNLFIRDRNKCQYCGASEEDGADLNIDHVVPRSKGGRTEWTNIVLSCISCNNKKQDKTLEQSGMKLARKPYVPTSAEIRNNRRARKIHAPTEIPQQWERFLSRLYWNVELSKE
jgi:5-methylcytosine-specific restriction endonuclease McrA